MDGRFQSMALIAALAMTAILPSTSLAQTAPEPAGQAAPLHHPATVVLPSWITPPEVAFPPVPAGRSIRDGRIELTCTSQLTGEVADCAVTYEDPQQRDLGLGATVVAATPSARMSPRTVNGAPEASTVRFVVRFESAMRTVVVGAPVGPAPEGEALLIQTPAWARQVTPDYPERAMAQNITRGQATLNCGFLSSGDLVDCRVVTEMPEAVGFGRTSLSGARRARVSKEIAEGSPSGSRVQFTLRFVLG